MKELSILLGASEKVLLGFYDDVTVDKLAQLIVNVVSTFNNLVIDNTNKNTNENTNENTKNFVEMSNDNKESSRTYADVISTSINIYPKPITIKRSTYDDVNYKYILRCPHGSNCQCNTCKIYEDGNVKLRRCQYKHDDNDCELGSRFCSDIQACGKVHGCDRRDCEYGTRGSKYNETNQCKKLFSCPFYHDDDEYERWVDLGLYDKWAENPIKFIMPNKY